MSRLRKPTCPCCGAPGWFHHWVGDHCEASTRGLSVTDGDLIFHRFKSVTDAIGSREVEHMMIVETKIADERLGRAQRDTLSVFNGVIASIGPASGRTIHVESRPGFIIQRAKKVTWHGVHLLRIPAWQSDDGPFVWDNVHTLNAAQLADVLSFRSDPAHPFRKLDIDRRHKAARRDEPGLFDPRGN